MTYLRTILGSMKSRRSNTSQQDYPENYSNWLRCFPFETIFGSYVPDNLAIDFNTYGMGLARFPIKKIYHFNKSPVEKTEALIFCFSDLFGTAGPISMTTIDGHTILPFNELMWAQGHQKDNYMVYYDATTSASSMRGYDDEKPLYTRFLEGCVVLEPTPMILAKTCIVRNISNAKGRSTLYNISGLRLDLDNIQNTQYSGINISMRYDGVPHNGYFVDGPDITREYFGYGSEKMLAKKLNRHRQR